MPLRMIDFQCTNVECRFRWEDLIEMADWNGSMSCECGSPAKRIIVGFPGIFGEENVPREQLRAARTGAIFGSESYIPPFQGSTRSELKTWEQTFNVVSNPRSDRTSRKLEINQKVPWTKTAEFDRLHTESVKTAMEIASAGEDAVQEALASTEKPNDYDLNAFAQQVQGEVIDPSDKQTAELTKLIAEELAPSK